MFNIKKRDRRSFLKDSGKAILAGTVIYQPLGLSERVLKGGTLKIGLIGCGGRGTGAAVQALQADPDVIITAMGDVFKDRLDLSYDAIKEAVPDKLKVTNENRFIGFDAYQKVIDSGVDVVLLATPPAFRPHHLTAAVNAGKHVFCEKPVAVDAPGVRKVLLAVKQAKEKNLSLVSGFCFRYDFSNRAVFGRINKGDIGDIRAVTTFRHGGEAWSIPRKPEWTQMTNQMRNWYYYNWLSGDFIVEQAVHSLDLMSWAMGDKLPVMATGTGGRQARVKDIYGNIYDHFAVEFEYENGAKGYHFTRQQAGASTRNSVDALGTAGNAIVRIGKQYEITGKNKWQYSGPENDMYQTQHNELFASIRKGKPINDGDHMANSTLLAIWARTAGYTGQTISFDQALNSKETLGPAIEDYDWNLKWDGPPIAVPGVTKLV